MTAWRRVRCRTRQRAMLFSLAVLITSSAYGDICRMTTVALDEMMETEVRLVEQRGRTIPLRVKLARKSGHRAAGFQHICADTISRTAILFVFEQPHRPGFHMRNVHAALDIAFIHADGVISDIQTMQPYVLGAAADEKIWHTRRPVKYALEVRSGYFSEMGVTPGVWSMRFLP